MKDDYVEIVFFFSKPINQPQPDLVILSKELKLLSNLGRGLMKRKKYVVNIEVGGGREGMFMTRNTEYLGLISKIKQVVVLFGAM